MFKGTIEIHDLEATLRAVNLGISLVENDPTTKGGWRHADLIKLQMKLDTAIASETRRQEWQLLNLGNIPGYFEINKLGEVRRAPQLGPNVASKTQNWISEAGSTEWKVWVGSSESYKSVSEREWPTKGTTIEFEVFVVPGYEWPLVVVK